jgi:hypothetical protein
VWENLRNDRKRKADLREWMKEVVQGHQSIQVGRVFTLISRTTLFAWREGKVVESNYQGFMKSTMKQKIDERLRCLLVYWEHLEMHKNFVFFIGYIRAVYIDNGVWRSGISIFRVTCILLGI